MTTTPASLIAVDVGNSRVKFGRFLRPGDCGAAALARQLPIAGPLLPEPDETLSVTPPLSIGSTAAGELSDWLASDDSLGASAEIVIASVNRLVERQLQETLANPSASAEATIRRLTGAELPIAIHVDEPDRVGIDRLLGAVAANRLRRPGRGCVVVDLGTAITVDLITPDGAFAGGAILPGIAMSARALNEQTDALPTHRMQELNASPDAVGKNTTAAIEAGLFWGAVGAVRELIARQSDRLTQPPQVFLTGGAAPSVARLLGGPDLTVRYLPHLVLSGIAVACDESGITGEPGAGA